MKKIHKDDADDNKVIKKSYSQLHETLLKDFAHLRILSIDSISYNNKR